MKLFTKVKGYFTLIERVIISIVYIIVIYFIGVYLFETWLPTNFGEFTWFISIISYLIFCFLTAPFFIKPTDSLAISITGLAILLTINMAGIELFKQGFIIFKWIFIGISLSIFISSIITIVIREYTLLVNNKLRNIQNIAQNISASFGKGEVIFTGPIIVSIFGFQQNNILNMVLLSSLWILIAVLKPLEIISKIIKDMIFERKDLLKGDIVGKIERIDTPNIIRYIPLETSGFNLNKVYLTCLSESNQKYILPLFRQYQGEYSIETGISFDCKGIIKKNGVAGLVYQCPTDICRIDILKEIIGDREDIDLIGFVVENSNISRINFEISTTKKLNEGFIVFCIQDGVRIYYQILDAETKEEVFESHPRGTHIVKSAQLGILDNKKGFIKYPWVPAMNTPVFWQGSPIKKSKMKLDINEKVIGEVPGSKIEVVADFNEIAEYHTAILGVTGTGKTEFAYDLIKHGLDNDYRIFCVDFTGEYKIRLSDKEPVILGILEKESEELERLIDNVETGEYSAAKQKKDLFDFLNIVKPNIKENVKKFLSGKNSGLGIFELQEISNTRATLRATELYLSEIFKWSQKNKSKKILIVLEEAHTIIPEMNLYGYDRVDTAAVVGRMSQIALQGRKYNVGLLIISQRTALVSKTVLSQCNTFITFSLIDRTSLDFLANVYSEEHVKLIPNLQFLEALVYGKAVKKSTTNNNKSSFCAGKKRSK